MVTAGRVEGFYEFKRTRTTGPISCGTPDGLSVASGGMERTAPSPKALPYAADLKNFGDRLIA